MNKLVSLVLAIRLCFSTRVRRALKGPPVVGLVVTGFDKGGLEQVVLNLYQGFRAEGVQVKVLVQENLIGSLGAHVSPEDISTFHNSPLEFLRLLLKFRVTHLSYHYNTFGLQLVPLLGIDCTYTIHNVYTWLNEADFRIRAAKLKRTRLIAVSSWVAAYFQKRSGRSDVIVIQNGVDIKELSPTEETGPRSSQLTFANVASFHRVKHQMLILQAAQVLAEKYHGKFQVLLVGNVGDPSYHSEVRNHWQGSQTLQAHVHFISYLPRNEMSEFYGNKVDCILLPSIQEGCSNVILEALYFNRPIISTKVGNIEDVAMGDNCIVIENAYDSVFDLTPELTESLSRDTHPRNLRFLVDAMARMIEAPEKYRQGAQGGRTRVLGEFTASRMSQRYLDVMNVKSTRSSK